MTKDEFIQEYSRFGHRTDITYESHRAGVPFPRWNLDKVGAYFDAAPCDCGHQECKGWKMRAKSMDPPEDCSVDPMTMFGPFGPPFTMMDAEQPEPLSFLKPPKFDWHFVLDGKTVGTLTFNEKTEKLDFSGDMHESAQIFFGLITERFEAWHKEKYGE